MGRVEVVRLGVVVRVGQARVAVVSEVGGLEAAVGDQQADRREGERVVEALAAERVAVEDLVLERGVLGEDQGEEKDRGQGAERGGEREEAAIGGEGGGEERQGGRFDPQGGARAGGGIGEGSHGAMWRRRAVFDNSVNSRAASRGCGAAMTNDRHAGAADGVDVRWTGAISPRGFGNASQGSCARMAGARR